MACFYQKAIYCVKISMGLLSRAWSTVSSFFDTGAGPSLINKDFQQPYFKQTAKSTQLQQLLGVTRKGVTIEGTVPLFFCIADLRVRPWLWISGDLALLLLGETLFTDRCICGIFRTAQKSSPGIGDAWRVFSRSSRSTRYAPIL